MNKYLMFLFAIVLNVISFMCIGLQAQDVDISADVFELNIKTNYLIASGNVTVTQDDTTLKSPWLSYHQDSHLLILGDNVVLEKGLLTIECEQIQFNSYSKELVGTGNVVMSFPPYSGRSDNIGYNNNIVTLSGSPILSKGDDELVAEEIIVDLIQKKVYSKGYTKYKSSKDDN